MTAQGDGDLPGVPAGPTAGTVPALPPEIEEPLSQIEVQFSLVLGNEKRVEEACARLTNLTAGPQGAALFAAAAARLLPLLARRPGGVARSLLPLLEAHAFADPDPRPILLAMLLAREDAVRELALPWMVRLHRAGRFPMDAGLAQGLLHLTEGRTGGSADDLLGQIRELLLGYPGLPAGAEEPLELLLSPSHPAAVRTLAARVLDQPGEPVGERCAAALLGPEAAAVLGPYLQFTRAGYADLIDVARDPGVLPAIAASFRRAEELLGRPLLGEVIGELGWARLSLGLSCSRWIGLGQEGSLPVMLAPAEAALLEPAGVGKRTFERFLILAHGGTAARTEGTGEEAAVQRFRRYNVVHAELLALILEVAPLTPRKVGQILDKLDRVTEDFAVLFQGHTPEAGQVGAVYARLKEEVAAQLRGLPADQPLASDLTRRVQMFEEPRNLEEVRTLHGLKRYLHQQGLRLAFRVFRTGRATNRTVELVLASPQKVLHRLRPIRYIDFEPEPGAGPGDLPFAAALVADAYGRRLLAQKTDFPDVEILIYGNEVQAFVNFRNHPVFVRLDLSPPQRGGMLDLEYFGVSQYEIDRHPDIALPWIQRIFRRFEFEVQAADFHLHVRYDKERALDLDDLIEKARRLCLLLPHLMEMDWIIGHLDYPAAVLAVVADAWADRLLQAGWLPLAESLTSDRRKILQAVAPDPAGPREIPWDGIGPYADRFTQASGGEMWNSLRTLLDGKGLLPFARLEGAADKPWAQIPLEAALLEPLREAVSSGLLTESADGFFPTVAAARRRHEAESFASLLEEGGEALLAAARMAFVIASCERQLRFVTIGAVQGYPVQRARVSLRGEVVDLAVLRDEDGIARLALAEERAFHFFVDPSGGLRPAGPVAGRELIRRLRRDNYLGPGYEPPPGEEDPAGLRARFVHPPAVSAPAAGPGERVVGGIVASPGMAAGLVRFDAEGRDPDELEGAVLIAPAVRPQDTPLLRRTAAVVSTGGGILSHAGLIALELGKPALVIAGRWQQEAGGSRVLAYRYLDYREEASTIGRFEVVRRAEVHEREGILRDGDLVAVDAEVGTLTILGRDREALLLQEGLRHLRTAAEGVEQAREDADRLSARGRWLRALQTLRRVLSQLERPALARHAARELLLASGLPSFSGRHQEVAQLLRELARNPRCGAEGEATAGRLVADLTRRHEALCRDAARVIPDSSRPLEILQLRLDAERLGVMLGALAAGLRRAGLAGEEAAEASPDIGLLARRRLDQLREELVPAMERSGGNPADWWRLSHLMARADLLDRILPGGPPTADHRRAEWKRQVEARRREVLDRAAGRRILTWREGGAELAPLIGAKGANLGELARILGEERVPPWFAVTHTALAEVLAAPPGKGAVEIEPDASSMEEAIERILARPGLDARRKSAAIRQLWRGASIPAGLREEITQAYRALAANGRGAPPGSGASGAAAADAPPPFVAVRSSAREEDTEGASYAGQFDTFLYIRGEEPLLQHILLAWASLWTERAILHREMTGGRPGGSGGGVLVQRIVAARAAGVLHTLSTTPGQHREMVINAGLGLGEGVVSGTVEVDHIVVSREGDPAADPLRFRYSVGDKSSRIVFDRRAGFGTCLEPTLYHQRLRPALEYADLRELVLAAARLEESYSHPLDIEFAFEEDALSILQVRPIVAFQNALRETVERFPLPAGRAQP